MAKSMNLRWVSGRGVSGLAAGSVLEALFSLTVTSSIFGASKGARDRQNDYNFLLAKQAGYGHSGNTP